MRQVFEVSIHTNKVVEEPLSYMADAMQLEMTVCQYLNECVTDYMDPMGDTDELEIDYMVFVESGLLQTKLIVDVTSEEKVNMRVAGLKKVLVSEFPDIKINKRIKKKYKDVEEE